MSSLGGVIGQDSSVYVVGILGTIDPDYKLLKRYTSAEHRPKLRQGLSGNCTEACSYAKATVSSLCERFKTGEVSVNELKIAGKNTNQILHLFEASSGTDRDKNVVTSTALQSVVEDRKLEFDIFLQHQTRLLYLCRYIAPQVTGRNSILFDILNIVDTC